MTPNSSFWSSVGQKGGGSRRLLTLAASTVGRVAVEAGNAAVAVTSGGQVLTLLAHTVVHTLAVAVTLAR